MQYIDIFAVDSRHRWRYVFIWIVANQKLDTEHPVKTDLDGRKKKYSNSYENSSSNGKL